MICLFIVPNLLECMRGLYLRTSERPWAFRNSFSQNLRSSLAWNLLTEKKSCFVNLMPLSIHRVQPPGLAVRLRQQVGDAGAGEPAGAGCLPGGRLGRHAPAHPPLRRSARSGSGQFSAFVASLILKGEFYWIFVFMYVIQHCFIPSDSTLSPTWLDLIHNSARSHPQLG